MTRDYDRDDVARRALDHAVEVALTPARRLHEQGATPADVTYAVRVLDAAAVYHLPDVTERDVGRALDRLAKRGLASYVMRGTVGGREFRYLPSAPAPGLKPGASRPMTGT
jgi:hypothetical protein